MLELIITKSEFLLAHDGHGSAPIGGGDSLLHYLLEPLHAPLWIAASIVGIAVWVLVKRTMAKSQQSSASKSTKNI